jgi:outer membrane murein-binding lipoprotein Lpp
VFYNFIIINEEKKMKIKLLSVILLGILSAGCTMENVQTEAASAQQNVEAYVSQASSYVEDFLANL